MADDLVITPGGLRPRSLVHHIEPGATLDGAGGHHRKLGKAGEVLAEYGRIQERPGPEALMPGNVARAGRPTPALGDGWIVYAYWNAPNPITYFSTSWVVPPAPASSDGQVVFLFNGIQSNTMIYQPVLQWGVSAAGGGNYWAVASWYADGQGGPAFHSSLVRVNPGDVLTGVMTLTGHSAAGYSYNCEFTGIANSGYAITNVPELFQAVETLECYGLQQASDYPSGKTEMSRIDIQTGKTAADVAWTVVDAVTDVGQQALIFDTDYSGYGEVDIYYGPTPYWNFGSATIAAGAKQDWWFTWSGSGDVGPQLFQAEPYSPSGYLATTEIAEERQGGLVYHATVANQGSAAAEFRWRGGGR
jgi:hypothetical protein